jgi:DNA topoisomerase-1
MSGPYGPYVQLGEQDPDSKKKPKRVSLPANLQPSQVTAEIALNLISLPRELGVHPEDQKKIVVNIGRFGPYIKHGDEFRSIPKTDSLFEIQLERALEILKEPKGARRTPAALKTLGNHPDDQQTVGVYEGKYGPYVKHGKTNATLPKGTDPNSVTLEEALALLAEKSGKKPTKKKAAAKTTAKKPAAKKATTKKTAAKKKAPSKKAAE